MPENPGFIATIRREARNLHWPKRPPMWEVRPARFDDPTFTEVMRGKRTRDIPLPAETPEGKARAAALRPGQARKLLDELKRQGSVNVPGASPVSRWKAREILHDGTVHGQPLTAKQRGLFGLIAGGGRPTRTTR